MLFHQDNNVTIYHGNSFEIVPQLADGSINLVVTDPPYGISYLTNHRKYVNKVIRPVANDDRIPFEILPDLKRVLVDSGAIYWFTTEDGIGLFNSATVALGMVKKRSLVWDKGHWTMGDLEGDYGVQTEYIAWAAKGRHLLRGPRPSNLIRVPRYVTANRKIDHPTQKPESLIAKLILASSDEGDTILDPFMGSGATLLAAIKLGRKAIGIELDIDYCVSLKNQLRQNLIFLPLKDLMVIDDEWWKTELLISKDILVLYYIEQKMSIKQIASLYNVCYTTIKRYLQRYEIPIRTHSEAQQIRYGNITSVKKQYRRPTRRMEYNIRTITCEGCGETKTDHFAPNQRYCSSKCGHSFAGKSRRNGEMRACVICGKKKYYKQQYLEQQHFFCSMAHAALWQSRNQITHVCQECGREYRVSANPRLLTNKFCSRECYRKSKFARDHIFNINAQRQRKTPNKFELSCYTMLDELGIKYEPQYSIGDKFLVDAFVFSHNLVIQFDGDYWHGNPKMFPLLNKHQSKQRQWDESQDAYMCKCGYSVVRFWQSEFNKSKQDVITKIMWAMWQNENVMIKVG